MTCEQTRNHIKFYARFLLFNPVKCTEYVALLDKRSNVEIIYLLFFFNELLGIRIMFEKFSNAAAVGIIWRQLCKSGKSVLRFSCSSRSNVIMELQTGEVISLAWGTCYAKSLTQNCEIQVSVWAIVWLRLELGMSFSSLMFHRYQSLLDCCVPPANDESGRQPGSIAS